MFTEHRAHVLGVLIYLPLLACPLMHFFMHGSHGATGPIRTKRGLPPMTGETAAYGLWGLVLVNSAVFIVFAYSFFKPRTFRDWRSFGAFSGFMVALFAEMYGFPLSIYFLSGWLQSRYPGIDWFSHDAGHLLEMLFGWKTNPHFGPFHILSFILIGYTTAERAVRAGARPRASWGLSPVVCPRSQDDLLGVGVRQRRLMHCHAGDRLGWRRLSAQA